MPSRLTKNYIARHQNRANQLLHLVGVPLTFVVSAVFLFQHRWWLAVGCFVSGYVLQFVGHALEGNDAGELVLIKRLLGLPYVEFAPPKQTEKSKESKNSG